MKQTAIDWLVEKLKENGVDFWQEEIEMIEEAKEMEKDRIIQFCKDYSTSLMYGDGLTEEEFYNQTFKSE